MRRWLLCVILFIWAKSVFSWGFEPHRIINKHAVLLLPSPLFNFFKKHIEYISLHATDPDQRRYIDTNEAPKHYIDLEFFDGIDSTPILYNVAKLKWGEELLNKQGSVPWTVYFTIHKLKYAFIEQNLELILKHSAELGHYVADLHVPLHTTKNYNGQLTNQHGIHKLWETEVAELYHEYPFLPNKTQYLENPMDSIWVWMWESHNQVNNVLECEIKCRKNKESTITKSYLPNQNGLMNIQNTANFILAYEDCLRLKVYKRMEESIQHVASCIYTSWILAGQPTLPRSEEIIEKPISHVNESNNFHDHGSCHP